VKKQINTSAIFLLYRCLVQFFTSELSFCALYFWADGKMQLNAHHYFLPRGRALPTTLLRTTSTFQHSPSSGQRMHDPAYCNNKMILIPASVLIRIMIYVVTAWMESLEFFSNLSFRPHYGPRVDSASNRKDYQEYF
jgi:hypothetical protein